MNCVFNCCLVNNGNLLYTDLKGVDQRTRKMPQWLRVRMILAEALSEFSHIHISGLKQPSAPTLEDMSPSSGSFGQLQSCVHTLTQIQTYRKNEKKTL